MGDIYNAVRGGNMNLLTGCVLWRLGVVSLSTGSAMLLRLTHCWPPVALDAATVARPASTRALLLVLRTLPSSPIAWPLHYICPSIFATRVSTLPIAYPRRSTRSKIKTSCRFTSVRQVLSLRPPFTLQFSGLFPIPPSGIWHTPWLGASLAVAQTRVCHVFAEKLLLDQRNNMQ